MSKASTVQKRKAEDPAALSDADLLKLAAKSRAGKATYAEKAILRKALALSGGVTIIDPTATRVKVQAKGTEYTTVSRVKAKVCIDCGNFRNRPHKHECKHWREVTDHTQAPLVMIENDAFRNLGPIRRRKYGPAEALILVYAIMSGRFLKAVAPHVKDLLAASGSVEPNAAEALLTMAKRYASAAGKAASGKDEEE